MAAFTLDRSAYDKRILTELQDELETVFKYQLLRSCSSDDASETQALVQTKEECFEYLRVSVTELYIKHKEVINKFWTSLDDEGRERVINADIMNILLCSLVSLKGGEDWISSIYSSNGIHEPCIWEVAAMRMPNVKSHFCEIEKVLLATEGDHIAEVYKTQPAASWKVSKLGMLVDFRRSFLYFFISLFITRCTQESPNAVDVCCCCYKTLADEKTSGSCEGFVYCSQACSEETKAKHDLLAVQQAAPEIPASAKKQRDIFTAEANSVIMTHEMGGDSQETRKKRGRPSRNGSETQSQTQTSSTTTTVASPSGPAVVEEISTPSTIVATPTPKQRGRPRKYPKIEPPPPPADGTPTPKKGRGRPRKYPLPVPEPAKVDEKKEKKKEKEKEKDRDAEKDVEMENGDHEAKEDETENKAKESKTENDDDEANGDKTGEGAEVDGDKAEKEQQNEE